VYFVAPFLDFTFLMRREEFRVAARHCAVS
jgi:hypothetical protein